MVVRPRIGLMDMPAEILLEIAKSTVGDSGTGWRLVEGLRVNPTLNKIRKTAGYRTAMFAIDLTYEQHYRLLPAITCQLRDERDVHHFVRTLGIDGQIGPREAPDDNPYASISMYDVEQLLLFFKNVSSLTLTCFTWRTPSAEETQLMNDPLPETFPRVTHLSIIEAEATAGTHFPFDVLEMLPALESLELHFYPWTKVTSPIDASGISNNIRKIDLIDTQVTHEPVHNAIIAHAANSVERLHIGFADTPLHDTSKIIWSPPTTTLTALHTISFHISRDAWDEDDIMIANMYAIARFLKICGDQTRTLVITAQPLLIFEAKPGGWATEVPWNILGNAIRNMSSTINTHIRIIGSFFAPDTPPDWTEKEAKEKSGEFSFFAREVKPTFHMLPWSQQDRNVAI